MKIVCRMLKTFGDTDLGSFYIINNFGGVVKKACGHFLVFSGHEEYANYVGVLLMLLKKVGGRRGPWTLFQFFYSVKQIMLYIYKKMVCLDSRLH